MPLTRLSPASALQLEISRKMMKLGMAKPEHPPTLDEKTSGYGVGVEPGTAAVAPAAGAAA